MKNLISNIRNGAAGGIILLFFSIQIIAIIGSLLFPDHFRYLNPANIAVLLKSMAPLGIMSLGVGILMISGEFDLSVGTLYTFCGIITASLVGGGLSVQGTGTESVYQMSPYLATLCGVLVGVMAGLLHGSVVNRFQIPSFIVTLGAMLLWKGATLLYLSLIHI